LPRFIHEFLSISNATDIGFSFTPLVSTLMAAPVALVGSRA
jgi:hypothetical protein